MHENNDNEAKITLGGVISSSPCWSNDVVVFRWWFSMRDPKNRMNSWKIGSNQFRQIFRGGRKFKFILQQKTCIVSQSFLCSMVSIKIFLHLRTYMFGNISPNSLNVWYHIDSCEQSSPNSPCFHKPEQVQEKGTIFTHQTLSPKP